jgi:lipopolysaccharide export system permease protein
MKATCVKPASPLAKNAFSPNQSGKLGKLKVELSKRFVFALASVCFVLVGIPLGIRSQRKESTIGMAISLAIALGFYLFAMLMLSLQKSYHVHPEILIWLPVGVCFALSAWFVKRNL